MSLYIGFNALYNKIGARSPDDGGKIRKFLNFIIRNGTNRAQDIIDNFTKFDKAVDEFRDRKDNSVSAYIFYKVMPRVCCRFLK